MEFSNLPKILIVSNNIISNTNNNGKTLKSIFSKYPKEKISQIYFSTEENICNDEIVKFNINEYDIFGSQIKKIIKRNKVTDNLSKRKIKKNTASKIVRESLWKTKFWNRKKLNNWIENFDPDVVFFMAGDSIFAYDFVKELVLKKNLKLITYITDDYILPRKNETKIQKKLRNVNFKKIKEITQLSSLFLTISPKMSVKYKEIFNKKSIVVSNISNIISNTKNDTQNIQSILYAGGIHLGRDKVLYELAKVIEQYNINNNNNIVLNIYCPNYYSLDIREKLTIENCSYTFDAVSGNELNRVYNSNDCLLIVESFDDEEIEKTALSLSTKVSEYLSMEKPILAIGSRKSGSINYLESTAFIIDDLNIMDDMFSQFISSNHKNRIENGRKLFNKNHNSERILEKLYLEFSKLIIDEDI